MGIAQSIMNYRLRYFYRQMSTPWSKLEMNLFFFKINICCKHFAKICSNKWRSVDFIPRTDRNDNVLNITVVHYCAQCNLHYELSGRVRIPSGAKSSKSYPAVNWSCGITLGLTFSVAAILHFCKTCAHYSSGLARVRLL